MTAKPLKPIFSQLLAEGGYENTELVTTLDFEAMENWRLQIPCLLDRKPECY